MSSRLAWILWIKTRSLWEYDTHYNTKLEAQRAQKEFALSWTNETKLTHEGMTFCRRSAQ